jgi:hypothetical protein
VVVDGDVDVRATFVADFDAHVGDSDKGGDQVHVAVKVKV